MAQPSNILNINVGVLGHVDSGKTSLGVLGGLHGQADWIDLTVLLTTPQWLHCLPHCQLLH